MSEMAHIEACQDTGQTELLVRLVAPTAVTARSVPVEVETLH
jgi:hypothetical protein